MAAKDMMTAKVVTVRPDAQAKTAINKLVRNKVSGMPVVDTKGVVVGVLTEADLLTARANQKVESIMNSRPVTVAPNASLKSVADTLAKKKIKRVIVVDKDSKLLGVVSRRDVLKAKMKK